MALFGCAPRRPLDPFAETTEADFDRLMDIHLKGVFFLHLKGVFFLTQTLLPLIADDGRVVNISSGLAASVCRAMRPTR
jgi:NAD(P)-dependent dehydrogenase (short-subunit alcohol dehydrogenase family)